MTNTIDQITRLVSWLCKKLVREDLIIASQIILAVINDERDDIRPRNDFQEKHPEYRKFSVDAEAPLTEAPPQLEPQPLLNYRELIAAHEAKTGKKLKPVRRREGCHLPPESACCDRCMAPAKFLYVNDGKKASQLRCKVCSHLFPSHRCRRECKAKYWCPHCGAAMYRWKHSRQYTSYKCPNDNCGCYTANLAQLNDREKVLQKTGMSSQFKLRYQYREWHFKPADLQTAKPAAGTVDLNRIHKHLSTVGLVLTYNVSFGLSSRMTMQVLRRIHQITICHQTVLNYVQAAAVLADNFTAKHLGPLADTQLAGDETYIRVAGEWNYTWFVIGAQTRAIRAYHVSDQRDTLAATATLAMAMTGANPSGSPIEIIADGNPSYDAAVHVINADKNGVPMTRRTVIGLANEDDESQLFRPFKQLVERLNRTYKFHTRARSGFKNQQGAIALTSLFVAHYNFLRPHGYLKRNPPIPVAELQQPTTLQGQWLKLLQMAG